MLFRPQRISLREQAEREYQKKLDHAVSCAKDELQSLFGKRNISNIRPESPTKVLATIEGIDLCIDLLGGSFWAAHVLCPTCSGECRYARTAPRYLKDVSMVHETLLMYQQAHATYKYPVDGR